MVLPGRLFSRRAGLERGRCIGARHHTPVDTVIGLVVIARRVGEWGRATGRPVAVPTPRNRRSACNSPGRSR